MAYLPLSTANLPDPVIDPAQGASPSDHFNTVIYTGNSLNPASVTGVGFQPDFVWAKTRSFGNTNHRLQDAVRGSNKRLMSDLTSAETDAAGGIQSFDADGFTVGDGTSKDGFIHFGGRTFVAWNWKANGSGVTNTDGSITSTVSANTTSGFSIVSYSGNSTVGATIGHGLSQAPEFVIFKARNTALSWIIQADALGSPDAGNYILFTSAAKTANNTVNTTFGASTITLDSSTTYNGTGGNYIAYCFHSVEGFSKFGSYVGNGGDGMAGVFVYTGFRPAYLLVKNATTGTTNWIIKTAKTAPYNQMNNALQANLSDAEQASLSSIDFLSNGFAIRNNGSYTNSSGNTYIYMAFAEDGGAFKYSRAR